MDILSEIYYLIDESLPTQHYPDPAAKALCATFTPQQLRLFDDYISEENSREDAERLRLFLFLVKLGLYIPGR